MNDDCTMNRLGNCRNRFQTGAKRVLTVCSAGLLRSPTAANVLHQQYGYNTRAAGITKEYALIPVDRVLIGWADEIVCVNEEVHMELLRLWGDDIDRDGVTVVALSIPDRYEWNDPELQDAIKSQYAQKLGEGNGT